MRTTLSAALMLLCILQLQAQQLSQIVKGQIVDKETKFPLPGATIIYLGDTSKTIGAVTDLNGYFRIDKIPVGRQAFRINFIGYKDALFNNIEVTSAKEVILNVELEESVLALQSITIKSTREGDVSNEMATVSARQFSVEETNRYAGSRGEPSRMASNFAGVQGADDSRNDIVIRGNSPLGVLWQMEGINIPNPNHFSIAGSTGGPVSIINNKILANSEFYTGAFPAEYGNAISGVFDLKLRNGNSEKREHSFQFGFLGTEFFSEGPINENSNSSYLVSYRYSTLALFNAMNIDIGTSAIPKYQDAAFKLNFKQKDGSNISLFGIGGISDIDILISDQEISDRNIYGENDRDQYFGSSMGIAGVSYTKPINKDTYIKAVAAASIERSDANHYLVGFRKDANGNYVVGNDNKYVVDSLPLMLDYDFRQSKYSAALFYYKKLNRHHIINAGINTDLYVFNFQDSVININEGTSGYWTWKTRWNTNESGVLIQPFIQWRYKISDRMVFTTGIHSQYFSLSNSISAVEPRVGLKWEFDERQSLSFGYGLHSQIQPTYMYFTSNINDTNGNPVPLNKNMDFTKSHHFVLSYDKLISNNTRMKSEIYYQRLFNIPVEVQSSSISLINSGASFSRIFPGQLINEGLGENYGIELTIERYFSKKYMVLLTGSVFESLYQGSDKVWRDTEFNGNYAFNALFSREFSLNSQQKSLLFGTKFTTAGGRRYGPVDIEKSELERDVIYIDALRNSLQFRPYLRVDLRLSYKINRPKVTHEIALDFVNILGIENILKLTYAPDATNTSVNPIREEYQLGFLPIFYYKIDF